MRFAVKIDAIIECPSEVAAKSAIAEVKKQLAKPYVRVLLQSGGVALVDHRVDPKPYPEK